MYSKFLPITFAIFFTLCPFSYAKDAEDIEGFPLGPVKQVVKTAYNRLGAEKWKSISRFNRKKHLLEGIHDWGNRSVRGGFRWNKNNDVIEALIYIDGKFHCKQTYQYDDQPNMGLRGIVWMESDYGVLFYRYKNNGNLSVFARYDANGGLNFKEEDVHDALGNRLDLKHYDANNQLIYRVVNEYFAPDQLSIEKAYDREGNLTRDIAVKYNANGKVIQSTQRGAKDGSVDKSAYEYDGSGHILKEVQYRNDQPQSQVLYAYSDDFRKQIRTDLDAQGNPTQIMESVFDERGNIVEIVYKTNDQVLSRYTYVYDEQNRKVKEEGWEKGRSTYNKEIIYDLQGNLVEEIENNNSITHIQRAITNYRYDKYGNMTERSTSYVGTNPQEPITSERVIWQYTYFAPWGYWILGIILAGSVGYLLVKKIVYHPKPLRLQTDKHE